MSYLTVEAQVTFADENKHDNHTNVCRALREQLNVCVINFCGRWLKVYRIHHSCLQISLRRLAYRRYDCYYLQIWACLHFYPFVQHAAPRHRWFTYLTNVHYVAKFCMWRHSGVYHACPCVVVGYVIARVKSLQTLLLLFDRYQLLQSHVRSIFVGMGKKVWNRIFFAAQKRENYKSSLSGDEWTKMAHAQTVKVVPYITT